MIANYHTHTPLCNHATGEASQYVRAAIDGNLQILGFSDHTPQFYPDGYHSHIRMRPDDLQEYVNTITDLQQQFAGQLHILLGLEAEYYPALFPELLNVLRDTPVEYLLLGQHWNGNEVGEPHNTKLTHSEKQLVQYCDQVIDAIYTGYFTYVAHPDVLNFDSKQAVYKEHMRRVCKAAKSCNIPLEINLLGLREHRHYPCADFWALAAEEGCAVVLGSDAHRPEDVLQPQIEEAAMDLVRTYNLELLETVTLRKI